MKINFWKIRPTDIFKLFETQKLQERTSFQKTA